MKKDNKQAQTQPTKVIEAHNLKCTMMSKDRSKFSSRRIIGMFGFLVFTVLVCCNAPSEHIEMLGMLSASLIATTTFDYLQKKTAS